MNFQEIKKYNIKSRGTSIFIIIMTYSFLSENMTPPANSVETKLLSVGE